MLSDDTYLRLRTAIVSGEHRPNSRLIEAELAEQLDVSRTPVRDALLRLASEGLVLSRRRGWVVREHTAAEITDIYGVRQALEGYAARQAATTASTATLQAIKALHAQGVDDARHGARASLVGHNDAFHDAIVAAAGNQRLGELIERNRAYYFNQRIAALYTDEEASRSMAGHQAIMRALLKRDGDAAERAAREHVAEALHVILAKLG